MHLLPTCYIHKHKQCDGIEDCKNGEDETMFICKSMSRKKCQRAFKRTGKLRIPLSWLKDGTEDCLDGIDEQGEWPTCGEGRTGRFVETNQEDCEEVYICSQGQKASYKELKDLCNGLDTCSDERRMCQRSHRITPTLNKPLTLDGHGDSVKLISHCLPGLGSLQSMKLVATCFRDEVNLEGSEIFGVNSSISLHRPDKKINCDYTFGEIYVILSCSGYCEDSVCPLKDRLYSDSCPAQFKTRIYTVVDNTYLTFVSRSKGSYIKNELFRCKNEHCINYDKVCNIIDDCGDGSDEDSCTNVFKCKSQTQLIPITKKCDGNTDCLDFSDECNSDCGKEIIDSFFLKCLSWGVGPLAILLNCVSFYQVSEGVFTEKMSQIALQNKVMIMLINFGDLHMGIHLVSIAGMDAIVYGTGYCLERLVWLTSTHCAVVGVISTIGYEISIIAMTTLSTLRLLSMNNSLRSSGEVNRRFVMKIIAVSGLILLMSVTIATVPLVGSFEDFFVNGVAYLHSVGLLTGAPGKKEHLEILQGRYRKLQEKSITWKMINRLVDEMFSRDYKDDVTGRRNLEFYGNDGVCLFKFFVKSTDPQRVYVWIILTMNTIFLSVMSVCYTVINVSTKATSKVLTHEKGETGRMVRKRNRKLQKKISIIIGTNLLCWLPVTLAACLHSGGVLDATPYYSIISIAFLPINSVVNPILYDQLIKEKVREIWRKTMRRLSTLKKQNRVHSYPQRGISKDREEVIEIKKIRLPTHASLAQADVARRNREPGLSTVVIHRRRSI